MQYYEVDNSVTFELSSTVWCEVYSIFLREVTLCITVQRVLGIQVMFKVCSTVKSEVCCIVLYKVCSTMKSEMC